MTAYHRKPLAMTLRKLTFSIGLLAASLMLAAPAQAETWSCSYINGKEAFVRLYVREGEGFRATFPSGLQSKWDIIKENEKVIHLALAGRPKAQSLDVVALFKKYNTFTAFYTGSIKTDIMHILNKGRCVVH